MLKHDICRAKDSGFLDLGLNNIGKLNLCLAPSRSLIHFPSVEDESVNEFVKEEKPETCYLDKMLRADEP